MGMTKCKECGEAISTKAEQCPKCGSPGKKKTTALTWVGSIIFLIMVFGYCGSKIPSGNISNSPSSSSSYNSSSSQGSTKQATQVTEVNIKEILSAYKNNEVGADNQYKDKFIRTTGIIGDIKKDIMNSLYVTLGTGKRFEIPVVQAFFDDSQNNQLAKLRKGKKLTVICRIEGLMMNVLGKDCVIE